MIQLPDRVSRLKELAYDLWWSWSPAATRLFACNMNECAIHDADGSVTFGTGARFPRELQIRDRDGAPVPTSGDIGRRRVAQVMDLLALQRSALP